MNLLIVLWNAHSGPLAKVRVSTASRTAKIAKRLKACPDLTLWQEAIERIAASRWCRGENPNGWRATFDFLLQEQTLARALEGVYDDRTIQATRPSYGSFDPTVGKPLPPEEREES